MDIVLGRLYLQRCTMVAAFIDGDRYDTVLAVLAISYDGYRTWTFIFAMLYNGCSVYHSRWRSMQYCTCSVRNIVRWRSVQYTLVGRWSEIVSETWNGRGKKTETDLNRVLWNIQPKFVNQKSKKVIKWSGLGIRTYLGRGAEKWSKPIWVDAIR